ncbi:MAG: YkgJ family cysteine cluster protein [Bryobacteraceae bacterium]|nr:YkgJ family cysteine cluster protein [Bryobacteraceae bacterium]
MVTDLGEVYRLGTEKAKENLAFRRYLAATHKDDEPFRVLAADVQRGIDCTRCANCCRHGVVTVSEGEIADIAAHLGIKQAVAKRLYTEPDPDEPGVRVLRHAGEDGCVFLDDNLCLIYEDRPKVCREFPYVASAARALGRRRASVDRWAALCPIVYNALERYKRLMGFRTRG